MTEKILKSLFFIGVLFLVFLAGIVASVEKTYFYWKVQEVYLYVEAKREEASIRKGTSDDKFIYWRARTSARGVTQYTPSQSAKGYTFYTDSTASAYLIDMDGRILHQWHLPYEKAFPDKKLDLDVDATWRGSRLMPDGSLIVLYTTPGHSPEGVGLAKLDKDSRLIWKYPEHTHHALDVDPDGNIYVLVQAIDQEPLSGSKSIHPPFIHDWIAVLSPNGEELKRISLLHSLQNSEFAYLVDTLPIEKGDLTHTNSISYITPELAKAFPAAKAGNVLVSMRNIGAIAVVDLEQEKITWLKQGVWSRQHAANLLANGNIILFDNFGKTPGLSIPNSRVLEYDPTHDVVKWSYEGTNEYPFSSRIMGWVQQLENGNVLITEGLQGRLFEVTREGKIVWEFYTPVCSAKNKELISAVDSGTRYSLQELPFLENH